MSEGEWVQPQDPDVQRTSRSGGFRSWRRNVAVVGAVIALVGVGAGAWMVNSDSDSDGEFHVEPADSVGADPFTTDGITLTVASAPPSMALELFGGSGDNGACAPDELLEFLQSDGDKAAVWVAALNTDPASAGVEPFLSE